MSEWQKIETAPKNPGVDILVYRPHAQPNEHIPQVGTDYWSDKKKVWMNSNERKKPTHWQPLPEPPQ